MKNQRVDQEPTGQTVFDVGMYDGSDTQYYLELGYRVVAIEANPNLAKAAEQRFAEDVDKGRLTIVNAAIAEGEAAVDLTICGEDLGSSSTIGGWVADRIPMGSYTVPATNYEKLVARYGVPFYLKVDIEGADEICVRGITPETRPRLLSFEVGANFSDLLTYLTELGYSEYKLISQLSFREAAREQILGDRIRRKVMRMLGYSEPGCIRIRGRHYKIAHSSGPGPWENDGNWSDPGDTSRKWNEIQRRGQVGNWYDLHAR